MLDISREVSGVPVQSLRSNNNDWILGMLRIGELTTGSHLILADNVYVARDQMKVQIILQSSKTHNKGINPHPPCITITSSEGVREAHCPNMAIMSNNEIEIQMN